MGEHDLEEFAGYLRSMKDRTGRSYEAVAKRAGISSSAVHRYCSGKGLPADFGTAERIAKALGAAPAELLELHRLWIRADAAQALSRTRGSQPAQVQGASGEEAQEEPVQEKSQEPGEAETGKRPPFLRRLAPRWRIAAFLSVGCAIALAVTAATVAITNAERGDPAPQPLGDHLLLSRACPPVMSLGEHDECVRELQKLLGQAGGKLAVDADFGPGTLRHVVAFQVVAGLPPNGLVDAATKRALYEGRVKMRRWSSEQVERRIREVFPEEPDRAVGIAKCMSFLDPFYSLPNVNGTRNWGVFQISDIRLAELGGTPLRAFDPEWNIQAARKLWSEDEDFSDWNNCDQPYRDREKSPAPDREKSPAPDEEETR